MTPIRPLSILVTGGAGFIGSHLAAALVHAGHQVTCLDDFSTGSPDNLSQLPSLETITADVNDARTWHDLRTRTFDAVFHYAATVGVRRTEENPGAVLNDAAGIRHLAQFARDGHAKMIVYASSSEVYGQTEIMPMHEDDGYGAWSPYTVVKMFGEHTFRALWEQDKVPTISLRFFNVFGPRQIGNGYGFVTGTFINQALHNEAPTIFGDGEQTRDFVYIDDNIQATLATLASPAAYGHVVNIGTGQETTIKELAHQVLLATGRSKLAPHYLPARPVEIRRRCADTTKLQQLVNYTCSTSLADGLKETVAWYQAQAAATTSAVRSSQ